MLPLIGGARLGLGSCSVVSERAKPEQTGGIVRVIVGYDGSDHAKRALERAIDMAGDDGEMVVVASAEPDVESPMTEGGRQDPSEIQRRRRAVEEAKSMLAGRTGSVDFVEAYGDPGNAIVKAADGADLVVVGSRGLSRLERLMLGSVSTKVVQRAPSDVLVVR